PNHADAWARVTVAARWLARKWVVWVALAAAGLGTIWLLWAASPGGPSETPPAAGQAAPVAPAVARETLQEKNLRIFREEVEPKVIAALGNLGGGEAHVVELRAEGSEVIGLVEGTRPLAGPKPPRSRFRYCVLARDLYCELDLSGTGDWKGVGTDRIVIRPEISGRRVFELSIPINYLGLRQAVDLLPPDERALEEFNALLRREPASTATELVLPG